MDHEYKLDAQQIDMLLKLSEDKLYIGLGQLLVAEEVFEGDVEATNEAIEIIYDLQPESILSLINRAKKYLLEQHDAIYQAVCIEWNYCEKIKDPALSDNLTLITYLVDLLTVVIVKAPITVTTIAVILVKKGLNSYCDCSQKTAAESAAG